MCRRVDTSRPISVLLRDTAINGFALWSGLGTEYWRGLFVLGLKHPRAFNLGYVYSVSNHPYHPPVLPWGAEALMKRYLFHLVAIPVKLEKIFEVRDKAETDPESSWRQVMNQSVVCKYADTFFWRAFPIHLLIISAVISSCFYVVLFSESVDPWYTCLKILAVPTLLFCGVVGSVVAEAKIFIWSSYPPMLWRVIRKPSGGPGSGAKSKKR